MVKQNKTKLLHSANMKRLNLKFELVANIFIILLSIFLAVVIVHKFYFSDKIVTQSKMKFPQPEIGTLLPISDMQWDLRRPSLILALQNGCRFCNESASFYKRLVEKSRSSNVRIIAVFPNSVEENRKYLTDLGIDIEEIRQVSFNDMKVSGTPTLFFTDEKGTIKNFWIGKLDQNSEKEVLLSIQ